MCWLHYSVLGYIVCCWVILWSVGLHCGGGVSYMEKVLGYMEGCWVTWRLLGCTMGSVGLHGEGARLHGGVLDYIVGSVGLHGGVLGYMVESVGLHGGVLGYMVGKCWVTWWSGVLGYMVESVGLHGGVLGYMVESVGLHCGKCWVIWWSVGLYCGECWVTWLSDGLQSQTTLVWLSVRQILLVGYCGRIPFVQRKTHF